MLKKMIIKNFALIETLELELHPGFNALTGETGAGKSIIIDAVDVVMGGQGLTEYIRSGENAAWIEAFFEIAGNNKVVSILEQIDLLPDDDEYLILSRELVRSGKNICRVNGRPVNLSVYKDVTKNLVDIYGQHHQQSLLDPQKHIELLDVYGGQDLFTAKAELLFTFNEYSNLKTKMETMESSEKEQSRMMDIYKYQFDEISNSNLHVNEDDELTEEKKILCSTEKLSFLSSEVYEMLYGGQKSAVDLINQALKSLKEMAAIDNEINPMFESLEAVLYQVEETTRDIKGYGSKIEADPNRLDEVENRLALITNLKKKYGNTIEEIWQYQEQVASSMELVENWEDEIKRLKGLYDKTKIEYTKKASLLTQARTKVAEKLGTLIENELKELNLPQVSFKVKIESRDNPGSQGMDEVEFMISPNLGEPLKPLSKIISGGEASRIMLAFKTILVEADSVSTMIFDEVDAGVGGSALQAVAQKLAALGDSRQVICVTHSPHIAAHADHHYEIVKRVKDGRTVTKINLLGYEKRVEETARMLSGDKITELTRKHAEEILHSVG